MASAIVKVEDAPELEFCGEFEKTFDDEDPVLFYDRFGNPYSASELTIPDNTYSIQTPQFEKSGPYLLQLSDRFWD